MREHIGDNLSIAYREPVKIVRGWLQYLYDDEGRCYVDAYNNVPHVGHVVTRVVKDTVTAQVELQAGPFRVVSLMTREAVDELKPV